MVSLDMFLRERRLHVVGFKRTKMTFEKRRDSRKAIAAMKSSVDIAIDRVISL